MNLNKQDAYGDIANIDDLLKNLELQKEFLRLFEGMNIQRGYHYTAKRWVNEEVILLLGRLQLVEDIAQVKQGEEDGILSMGGILSGGELFKFKFSGDTILNILDRAHGKTSIVRDKTLEFIARHIGDLDTGPNLVGFLRSCGVPDSLVEYPNTKWKMVYSVLVYYASSPHEEDYKMLYKIIEEALHPLMYEGNEELAKQAQAEFNKYLKYDGLQLYNFKLCHIANATLKDEKLKDDLKNRDTIPNSILIERLAHELCKEVKKVKNIDNKQSCKLILEGLGCKPLSEEEAEKCCTSAKLVLGYFKKGGVITDYSIEQCGAIFLSDVNNEEILSEGAIVNCKFYPKKVIAYLKSFYEPKKIFAEKIAKLCLNLINIIELYFQKPITRDEKLNHFYTKISEEIEGLLSENKIPLLGSSYRRPFSSLFSAQKEMAENKTNLQTIINSLNAFYGEIHKFISLYNIKEERGNELEGLENYINSLRDQKEKQQRRKESDKKEPIPIKIIDEVKIKGSLREIKKDKGKPFPKLLAKSTKWEDIEMKFKNEFEVEIFIKGKFYKDTNYEELGFYRSGTKDKHPDVQWHFLTILSVCQEQAKTQATIDNMASSLERYLNKKVSREMCEQIKSKLSKKLQEKFGIDEEPFCPYKEHGFYQPRFKLKPVPSLRGDGEPFITKTPYDDNKRYS